MLQYSRMKKLLASFAFIALSVASAATYRVSLTEPSFIQGKTLKPGDYVLNVKDNSVVILKNNKLQVEVPAKIEDRHNKYERTRVLYNLDKDKFVVQEIEIGGTTIKVTINNGGQPAGGE